MIQAAFGWWDYHLHAFQIGDLRYGPQAEDYPEDELDEAAVTIVAALEGVERFSYEYDFGDSWDHEIVIEERSWLSVGLKVGVCIDGQNACPPEDVGGPGGYAAYLQALADPRHPEHDDLLEWRGAFDPAHFDLASANARLQNFR